MFFRSRRTQDARATRPHFLPCIQNMAEPVTAEKRPAEDEASAPQAKRLRDEPTETDEVGTRDVYRMMVDLNARADALERLLDDLKRAFDRDGTGSVPPN